MAETEPKKFFAARADKLRAMIEKLESNGASPKYISPLEKELDEIMLVHLTLQTPDPAEDEFNDAELPY